MKTLIVLLLGSISLGMLTAQVKQNQSPPQNPIDRLFDAVQETEDVFKFELSGFFLNLAKDNEDGKKKNGIKAIRVLGADHADLLPGSALSQLQKGLRANSFETLSEIRSGGDRVQIMMKENKNVISEFVALIKGDDGVLVISIEGAFNLDDIEQLDIDIDGFDTLKEVTDEVDQA